MAAHDNPFAGFLRFFGLDDGSSDHHQTRIITVEPASPISRQRSTSTNSAVSSEDISIAGQAMFAAGIPSPLPLGKASRSDSNENDMQLEIDAAKTMANTCRQLALQHETSLAIVTASLADADALISESADAIDDAWPEKIGEHVRRNAQLRMESKQATRRATQAEKTLEAAQARIAELEALLEKMALESSADISMEIVGAPLMTSPCAPSSTAGTPFAPASTGGFSPGAGGGGGSSPIPSGGVAPSQTVADLVSPAPPPFAWSADEDEAQAASPGKAGGTPPSSKGNGGGDAPPGEGKKKKRGSVLGRLARLGSSKGSSKKL